MWAALGVNAQTFVNTVVDTNIQFRSLQWTAEIHTDTSRTYTAASWVSVNGGPYLSQNGLLMPFSDTIEHYYGNRCGVPDSSDFATVSFYVSVLEQGSSNIYYSDTVTVLVGNNNLFPWEFGLHQVHYDYACDSSLPYQMLVYYGPTSTLASLEFVDNLNRDWNIDTFRIELNSQPLIFGYDTIPNVSTSERNVLCYPNSSIVINNGDTIKLYANVNNIDFGSWEWSSMEVEAVATGNIFFISNCGGRPRLPNYNSFICGGGTSTVGVNEIWMVTDTSIQGHNAVCEYNIGAGVELWMGNQIDFLLGTAVLIADQPGNSTYQISNYDCNFGTISKMFSFRDQNTGQLIRDTVLSWTNIQIADVVLAGVGANSVSLQHTMLWANHPNYNDGMTMYLEAYDPLNGNSYATSVISQNYPQIVSIIGLQSSRNYILTGSFEDTIGGISNLCFQTNFGMQPEVYFTTNSCLIATVTYSNYDGSNLSFTISFPLAMAGDVVMITTPDTSFLVLLVAQTSNGFAGTMSYSVPAMVGQVLWLMNPCGQSQSFSVTTTGLESINPVFGQLNIYPNPTTDAFIVSNLVEGVNYNFELIDLNGRLVRSGTIMNTQSFDIADLISGVYVLKVRDEDGKSSIAKVIKS